MSLPTQPILPAELHRPILEHINSMSDIKSLLLSSAHLNREAERLLYHTIVFQEQRPSRLGALRRIIECPRVAVHVHQLDFRKLRITIAKHAAYLSDIKGVFHAIPNLQTLHLPIPTPAFVDSLPLPGGPFRLSRLSIVHIYASLEHRDRFFREQASLHDLHMEQLDISDPLPPDLLPNLSVLHASQQIARQFLPHRQVTHLSTFGLGGTLPFEGLTNVRALSIPLAIDLHLYQECFPTLVFLEMEISIFDDHSLAYLQHMPVLAKLRAAIIASRGVDDDEYRVKRQIDLYFQACKPLREVELIYSNLWPEEGDPSIIYHRDQPGTVCGTWDEYEWKKQR